MCVFSLEPDEDLLPPPTIRDVGIIWIYGSFWTPTMVQAELVAGCRRSFVAASSL